MIFIFPTQEEAARFRVVAPDVQIEICGVGLAQAAASISAIIERSESSEELLLCGIAGSYCADRVGVGEVVEVVEESISQLPSKYSKSYTAESQTHLRGVKSNSVNTPQVGYNGADIENMEGASFMALCAAHARRGVQIRAISNVVGEPFEQWRVDEALDNLTSYLIGVL